MSLFILAILLVLALCALGIFYFKSIRKTQNIQELESKVFQLQTQIDLEQNYHQKSIANEIQKHQSSLENLSQQIQTQKEYYEKRLFDEAQKLQTFQADLKDGEKFKKELQLEFENLSQKILDHKTQDFNQAQFKTLQPFQKEIKDFKDAFEKLKDEQIKDRSSLITEIKILKEMNESISKEASNLTKALKGESKTRGNWGEMILESLLEKSGFIEGQTYCKQVRLKDEISGKNYQPDIIVNLPDKRLIAIDSKLNLNAYDALIAAENRDETNKQIKNLLMNIQTHLNELADKKYHLLTKGESLDFTIMFVPIEGAFIEAMRADPELFNKAYDLRVVITSPSTLMSILMTINNLWKNEKIDKDYRNIITKISALQGKMQTFCKYIEDLGKSVETLQNRYEIANNALRIGKGNIVDRIQNIQNFETKALELSENSE